MPLGLWKSKWEIHREDMDRYREEADRRDAEHREKMERFFEVSERRSTEHREKMERFSEEMREERAASDGHWLKLSEKYDRELEETRRFNREMLERLDKTYANLHTTLSLLGDEVIAMRGEVHELKDAVDAQTQAIMKLVDRFEDPEGRPPV